MGIVRRSALVLAMVLASNVALAQDGPVSHLMTEEDGEHAENETEADVPVREVPDYDGRERAPSTAARKLLWIPRVLFAPLYFLTEYVLRRPLSRLSRLAEQSTSDPLRFFVFGKNQQAAIAPTLLVDFGEQPSVGFYFRWNDVGHPRHKLRMYFATWGRDWLRGSVLTRWEPEHERWRFELRFEGNRRSDGRFYGLGSEIGSHPTRELANEGARFSYRLYDVSLAFEAEPWRASHFRAYVGVRETKMGNNIFRGESIEAQVGRNVFRMPPGYPDGYFIWNQGFSFTLNTRQPRPANTSGLLLHVFGEHAFEINDPEGSRWVKYGASAGAFVDIRAGHVIELVGSIKVADSIAGEIPFTEVSDLGGRGPMRGFRTGWLRGASAATLVMQYSWPIWSFLDGITHFGIGNVFDGRFDNFNIENMRMSFGIGFGAVNSLDHRFDFTVAWGTDTFERGPNVISTRIMGGATLEF